jgi:myo-inositol-1(or 4)-monophosphatase
LQILALKTEDFNFIFPIRTRKPFTLQQSTKLVEELTKIGLVTSIGSVGLHYCYVACGRADVAITLNKDVFPEFAGKLIVEEAGGVLTDFSDNELGIRSEGIIATRADLHQEMLRVVSGV